MSKRTVMVGTVPIGGGAPVSIQSMTSVEAHDEEGILQQIRRLQEAGCDIVRLAVPDQEAVEIFRKIKRKTSLPLVADIHFDYRLALMAIRVGADKIRINPGNIGTRDRLRKILKEAGQAGIPIRIGVNSGSLEKDLLARYGRVTAEALAESALRNARMVEEEGFENIVLSLKSSDVRMNYEAYKLVAQASPYPLHVGLTEAGTERRGRLKSAIGIGSLLLAGIGDTIRVSLTADPVEEVFAARQILETVGMRKPDYDLVSCPTCGRTAVDLCRLSDQIDRGLAERHYRKGLKVAVMGCAVNGPGEAAGADYGVAAGKGKGLLFAGGKILASVPENRLVEAFFAMLDQKERIED